MARPLPYQRGDKIILFDGVFCGDVISASRIKKKCSNQSCMHNELRSELATKEFVRAEIGAVRAEIKQNVLLLKILIGITVFGLTLFNPAFVKLVELIMK